MKNLIIKRISEGLEVRKRILENVEMIEQVEKVCLYIINCYKKDGKVLFCGNGGSAADAQHIAGELSGRFYLDRPALFAEALHVNTSYMTAVANDYSFEEVYARAIRGQGRPGDVLLAFSTSGNSPNILKAIEAAKEKQMIVVGFSGLNGGKMNNNCDVLFKVPSDDTPRIQEAHIMIGHIICELVEAALFGNEE